MTLPSVPNCSAEEEEEAPAIIFTITDSSGDVVRRLTGPVTAGMQRVDVGPALSGGDLAAAAKSGARRSCLRSAGRAAGDARHVQSVDRETSGRRDDAAWASRRSFRSSVEGQESMSRRIARRWLSFNRRRRGCNAR